MRGIIIVANTFQFDKEDEMFNRIYGWWARRKSLTFKDQETVLSNARLLTKQVKGFVPEGSRYKIAGFSWNWWHCGRPMYIVSVWHPDVFRPDKLVRHRDQVACSHPDCCLHQLQVGSFERQLFVGSSAYVGTNEVLRGAK